MNVRAKNTYPLITAAVLVAFSCCAAGDRLYFDISDTGAGRQKGAVIRPWKVIALERDFGGRWVVAGDIDGDKKVEIVAAENHNVGDVHYTSAVAAQELDGSVLWTWGDPAIGRKEWHHDVACQIHDYIGGDEREVVVCDKSALVVLDGKSGKELRRIKTAPDAGDCLVFCNLVGSGKPAGAGKRRDVLVKDRYHNIRAYNQWGNLLWEVTDPGGFRTAHQPFPVDIDLDGHDEIMAGYAMLNHDGSVRWVFQSQKVDQKRGHLDCVRILRRGENPADFRLVLTTCGANSIAMIDGNGKHLWEIAGYHFESIDIGRVFGRHPGPQILVDIDHQPLGKSPMWILDETGQRLGQITTDYSRHHALLDWTGDGLDEIIVAYNGAVYDNNGRRIATLTAPGDSDMSGGRSGEVEHRSLLLGDMDGDGVQDVIMATNTTVCIYRNEHGKKTAGSVPLGTGPNVTLY